MRNQNRAPRCHCFGLQYDIALSTQLAAARNTLQLKQRFQNSIFVQKRQIQSYSQLTRERALTAPWQTGNHNKASIEMKPNIWNHNIHYHSFILRCVPARCGCALDAGCGAGLLARKLAVSCREVVAVDTDRATLVRAQAANPPMPNLKFEEADVMAGRFSDSSFDLITAVATLHHLPLIPALTRLRNLLKPGGVLAIVGLYRMHEPQDYAWAAAALPASRIMRWLQTYEDVGAPLREPKETLREIRAASAAVLPGSCFRRRLFFRYSLTWQKPR